MSCRTLLAPSAACLLLLPAALAAPSNRVPTAPAAQSQRIPVLILTGENRTDWRWTSTWMRQVLEQSGKFDVEVTMYPNGSLADSYDTSRFDVFVVDYAGVRWGEPAESNFLETITGGKGTVLVGAAVSTFPDWKEFRGLSGFSAASDVEPADFGHVKLSANNLEHPLIEGMDEWPTHSDRIQVGLTQTADTDYQWIGSAQPANAARGAKPTPALLVGSYGKGRVVATPLGWVDWNDRSTWEAQQDPVFQQLLVRSVEWAARGELTPLSRVLPNTLTAADRAAGWKLLFDGTSTSGWEGLRGGFPEDVWSVEGGELRVTSAANGQDLFLDHALEEFELELEWKVAADRPGEQRGAGGLALHDQNGGGSQWSAGFATAEAKQLSEADRLLRPAGEWNETRVVARSDRVEHWLNGSRVTTLFVSPGEWASRVQGEGLANDTELSQSPLGRLALEHGGVDVSFRNIRIRPIQQVVAASNGGVQSNAPAPLDLLADGLNGWTYIAQEIQRGRPNAKTAATFTIEDGNEGRLLVDAGWPVGYLATDRDFGDYLLEFDWRNDPQYRQAGEAGVYLVFKETPNQRNSGGKRLWPDGVLLDLSPNTVGSLVQIGRLGMTVNRSENQGGTRDQSQSNRRLIRPMRQRLVNRIGAWNHVEVRYAGGDLTVKLNGEVVNAASNLHGVPSRLAIKATSTKLHFRNMKMTSAAR